MFVELSDYIRSLLPSDGGDVEAQSLAASWLRWLHRIQECRSAKELLAFAWKPLVDDGMPRGGHWLKAMKAHGRYTPAYLMNALRVSMATVMHHDEVIFEDANGDIVKRHTTHLKNMMYKTASLFPKQTRAEIREQIDNLPVPCRRRLEKGRFHLDCAFMDHMRLVHEMMVAEECTVFPLADSSQLRVGNVFCSEYFYIMGGEALHDLGLAALNLKSLPKNPTVADAETIVATSLSNKKLIDRHSGRHTLPAVWLGPRHPKLPHKLACWMHGYRLETKSWKSMRQFSDLFVCAATDSGTEKLFRTCQPKVSSPFPWWTTNGHAVPVESDVGMHLDQPDHDNFDDQQFDFTRMLGVRGTMHAINKLQEVLLVYFNAWCSRKGFINTLCLYFGNKDSLKEFCHEGLLKRGGQDVFDANKHLFQSGPPL